MATTTYTINIVTNQAQKAVNDLNNSLKSLANFAIGTAAIASFIELADSVTQVNNRLQTISKSQQDVNRQFDAMTAIALSNRASLESVTEVYTKLMMSSKTLGINQQEAAKYTDILTQAIKISGASTAEANSTILQFSQGLSAGVFQGDELKSILENNIIVTRALAKEMGVSTTEIKKMGSEGKITADVMLNALKNSAGEISSAFNKMTPTISESFNSLKTASMSLFNELEKNSKVAASISNAMQYIAFSMDGAKSSVDNILQPLAHLVTVLLKVGAAFLAMSVIRTAFTVIIELVAIFISLTGAITTAASSVAIFGARAAVIVAGFHPVLRIVMAVVSGLSLLAAGLGALFGVESMTNWVKSFGDANSENSKELAKMREDVKNTAISNLDNTKLSTDQIKELNAQRAKAADDAAKKVNEAVSKETAALRKLVQAYKDTASNQLTDIRLATIKVSMPETEKASLDAQIKALDDYRKAYNDIQADIEAKQSTKSEADLQMIPKLQEAQKELTKTYENQLEVLPKMVSAELEASRAYELGTTLRKERFDLEQKIGDIQHQMATSTMTGIAKIEADIRRDAEKKLAADVRDLEVKRGEKISQEEYNQLQKESLKNANDLIIANTKQYEQSRTFAEGWKKAFNTYIEEASNAAKMAENLFNKAMSGVEDAIFNLVKTGKFQWQDLAQSLADEFLKGSIKSTMGSVLDGLFGDKGMFGNLLGSSSVKGQSMSNPLYVLDVSGGGNYGGNNGSGSSGGTGGAGFMDVLSGGASVVGDLFGGLGDVFSGVVDFFGGFFANGGNLAAGKWGVVGENGPELIKGPATVISNKDMMAASSIGYSGTYDIPNNSQYNQSQFNQPIQPMQTTVNYNINAVDAMSFKQMIAADPSFIYAVSMQGQNSISGRR